VQTRKLRSPQQLSGSIHVIPLPLGQPHWQAHRTLLRTLYSPLHSLLQTAATALSRSFAAG